MKILRHISRGTRLRVALAATALLLASASAGVTLARPQSGGGVRAAATAKQHPCGTRRTAPRSYRHVIWIIFENQSYGHVIGNRQLPATNRIARQCASATNFHAEDHPSLPNYIAMTSGSTQGVSGDSSGPLDAHNIYEQVKRSGRQWRHYAFGMPRPCESRDSPSSSRAIYTAHHQPPIFYRNLAADCARWDVGVGDPAKVEDRNDIHSGPLARALDTDTLPAFATIGPTDDGGDSGGGGEVDPIKGDAFLSRWIPRISASKAYRSGQTAIFVTWDENEDFSGSAISPTIPTFIIAPSVRPGNRPGARYDHYSMLRTTQELLGLKHLLGHAANAPSMRRDLHL